MIVVSRTAAAGKVTKMAVGENMGRGTDEYCGGDDPLYKVDNETKYWMI